MLKAALAIVGAAALFLAIGCSDGQEASSANPANPTPRPMAPQSAPAMGNADLSIDTSASGIKGAVSDADLAKDKTAYETAKKAFVAKPTDQTTDDYVMATVTYGSATMLAESLDAKSKYRGALALYREANKIQVKGDKAKAFAAESSKNEQVIVNIYKMMGRPVPE